MKKAHMVAMIAGIVGLVSSSVFAVGLEEGGANGKGNGKRERDPAQVFKRLDTDENGELSLAEFKVGAERRRARRQERRGSEEGREGPTPEKVFEKLDKDGNGALSEDEFVSGAAQGPGRRKRGEGPEGEGAGRRGGRGVEQ